MKKVKKVKPIKISPAEKKKLWLFLYTILLVVLALDFFYKPYPYFGIDGTPFFFAWFGFISCIAIIIVSKSLNIILKRPENYYKGDEE
jgi:uncharacterized membrane protein YhdT